MQKELENNLEIVNSSIELACDSSGINSKDILLIAVSKRKSLDHIKSVIKIGVTNFGENYSQELQEKSEELALENIFWHFIGPIQSNKIKIIAKHAHWVHSLDRESVVVKLNDQCGVLNKTINGLIQINISNESSKSGIAPDEMENFAKLVEDSKSINLRGIMVLPKLTDDIEETKSMMRLSKDLHDKLVKLYPHASYLSMGTTSDFQMAIKCGSNMLRIGELIFGKRL